MNSDRRDIDLGDLRAALDDMAQQHTMPDPHTVLAGAEASAMSISRRRTMSGVAAVAATLVIIGGASLLFNGGEEPLGQIDPAVPDTSYADGYGIIGGEPQPFMDGLRLLDVETIEPGPGRVIERGNVASDEPLYAVAWCTPASPGDFGQPGNITIDVDDDEGQIPCFDRAINANDALMASPIPTEGPYVVTNRSEGKALVAFYGEPERGDYPFPSADPAPFPAPNPGVVVINAATPPSRAQDIEAIPDGSRVFRASVPITKEIAELSVEISEPGQVLVAVDGVVLTNDGEALPGQREAESNVWDGADPTLRGGYVAAFGPPRETSFRFSKSQLDAQGVDVSDRQFTITVYPLGFADESTWRVSYTPDAATGTADRDTLLLQSDSSGFPEFAFGHRLIGSFEVPSDGAARYVEQAPADATATTWVVDCSEFTIEENGAFEPKVGTVITPTGVGDLQCFGDDGWNAPTRPYDIQGASNSVMSTQLTALATQKDQPLAVAAYEPMSYEEFPFDEGEPVVGFEGYEDGDDVGGGYVAREIAVVTLDDLDSDGSIIFDLPDSRFNELYFTTEGKGRFWLESADPSEGTLTPSGRVAAPGAGTYGNVDYWTSWTDAEATWPILAETDDGVRPERMRLRVEGYDDGDFAMRAFGQFQGNEQP